MQRKRHLFPGKSVGDWIGIIFFSAAVLLAGVRAMHEPGLFTGLSFVHNATLAVLFCLRRPSTRDDRLGLVLAVLAVSWPTGISVTDITGWRVGLALLGIGLVFWSLLALGRSFGLAPDDRGLVQRGPYRIVRHPMYLGELVYLAARVAGAFSWLHFGLLVGLGILQVMRILREERLITDYADYTRRTRWRLLPGVW
jgi:hypothetical protein